ncbi:MULTISPECIES: 1-phosphofructokinase [Deinococcus]|uniref:1-phosphofructokinase n=1 Tax=Deinococcus geothermalis (strain DSM 11300 / CIP 105573 / AG-3a) TaxID=319795 RepID=Q1IWB6_DEIGD|nr:MULTISPECIES: 1-phosphofructokinase [Deinococcus]ABF46468.1 fructose-1-phosphate kinase [Deinococcus geothermalis DSM 11300]MBI0444977.1 1-phosphofructokinase [Deinococcus sp. DB0503]
MTPTPQPTHRIATLTLNPALDLTVRADGWRQGEVNIGQSLHWDAGGKGVNVAAFLADWGLPVTATGLLGDQNPERFETLFRTKGIRDDFVRVSGATRVGVKLVDGAAQETTDINLPGLAATPEALQALEARLDRLTADHSVFVLAGSLPPGVAPDFYARLIARLRAAGCFVALDTSGAALQAALAADVLPDLVKPNIHELEAALGRPLGSEVEVLEAARELLRRGAGWVAVSQGERGALLVTEEEAVRARPPRVAVKSTVGAGDAMVAGLLSAHLDGLNLMDAARRATAFSLAAITRLGAHLPSQAELEEFARQVAVEPVAQVETA